MPRLKYIEIPKRDLSELSIVAGQVIHCLDTKECYYDNSNTIRILSEDIEPVYSIASEANPANNRLYIDRHGTLDENNNVIYQSADHATLYIYNKLANWQQVTDTAEINSFLSSYTELEPAILEENGRNKAPYTLAKCVFTQNGDNLEDLVKEIKLFEMTSENITVEDDETTIFNTYPPFPEYHKYPNRYFSLVFIDGQVIPDTQYKWLDNKLNFLGRTFNKGQVIFIIYIYMADLNTSDSRTAGYTDGSYILDNTVPAKKLQKTTNSYIEDDEESVPTAKALHDMHRDLLQKINTIDSSTQIYAADSSSNNYEIVLFIKKYVPTDCNTITLRVKYDLGSDCYIRINDFEPVPIYTAIGSTIKEGQIKAGTVISLRYNAQQQAFYLINPDLYKVVKDRFIYEIDGVKIIGPRDVIPIQFEDYKTGIDQVDVYYQNIRLFEGINYYIRNNNIVLKGFYAQNGDVFIVERTRVIASNL